MQIKTFKYVTLWLVLLAVAHLGSAAVAQKLAPDALGRKLITSDSPEAGRPASVSSRGIHIKLTSSSPEEGINGFVEDKNTGARIEFFSKMTGAFLTAQITNSAGLTLIEYNETERVPVINPETGEQAFEWDPALVIGGIEYTGVLQGPVADEMKAIAASPEGNLIRGLALLLVLYAPDEQLEAERRGLAVAYQAMQRFYPISPFKEFIRLSPKVNSVPDGKDRKIAPSHAEYHGNGIALLPEGCSLPRCVAVESHDYQLSEQGGFVIKSTSPRLVFSHNYARPEDRHAHESEDARVRRDRSGEISQHASQSGDGVIKPTDDDSQVGSCYGRCGAGCGNWSHEWVGTPTTIVSAPYCRSREYPEAMERACVESCAMDEYEYFTEYGTAVHTARGKVTPASKAHDWCCRNLGGCWNPVCYPSMVEAGAECANPLIGSEHTWSYIGYHEVAYEQPGYTGTCWEQATDCCRTYGY